MQLALIGCGQIARRAHLPNLQKLGLSPKILADPIPQSLESAARFAPEARHCRDWREILQDPEIRGVLISSPPDLHADQAVACLEVGKPVYLEKPLANRAEDALRIVAAAQATGVPLMVGFNLRFHPLILQMRQQWQRVGQLHCIRSLFTGGWKIDSDWRAQAGPLLELACHHLDLARFLSGNSAELVHLERSHLHAQVLFRLGETAFFDGYYSLDCASDEQFQVYGSQGRLSFQRNISSEVEFQPRLSEGSRWRKLASLMRLPQQIGYLWQQQRAAAFDPSYEASLRHFLEVCRQGQLGSAASAQDGWEAIRHFL